MNVAYLLEDAATYFETLFKRHGIPLTERGIDPEKLRTAAAAIPQWQPIDTAPKDGTKILVMWGGERVITYWAERVGFKGWQPPAMMTIKVSNKEDWVPQYWMPLPAPKVETSAVPEEK